MQEFKIINEKLDKVNLLNKLSLSKIKINNYAKLIFDYPTFNYKNPENQITIVQLKLSDLGLKNGGNFEQIVGAMKLKSLDFCPLEFAPYIRLHYKSQRSSSKLLKINILQIQYLFFRNHY